VNPFEEALSSYIGEDNLKKLQSVKIGIAGAGGLGSNSAFNLVRSGFKQFVIVDFDLIEYSNLNRQFYFRDQIGNKKVEALKDNLLKINPDLDIKIIDEKITVDNISSLFMDCDIIIEAFDRVDSKKIIVEKFMNSDKLLVAASGIAGWGVSDEIKVKKIKDSFYLIGDFVTEVRDDKPPISPRVNIVAAKQADTVLKAVLEGEI